LCSVPSCEKDSIGVASLSFVTCCEKKSLWRAAGEDEARGQFFLSVLIHAAEIDGDGGALVVDLDQGEELFGGLRSDGAGIPRAGDGGLAGQVDGAGLKLGGHEGAGGAQAGGEHAGVGGKQADVVDVVVV